MRTGRIIALLGGALTTCAIAFAVPGGAQSRINPFAHALLEEHNAERDRLGVPRLEWSQDLAQQAQRWAVELAKKGRMEHASRDARNGTGENLWMGAAGYYGPETMIGMMVDEKKHFTPGTFPQVSRTGQWRDVGHYTQIIWRETQQVGCAVSKGRTDDFLVCRYWPAGNTYGKKAY